MNSLLAEAHREYNAARQYLRMVSSKAFTAWWDSLTEMQRIALLNVSRAELRRAFQLKIKTDLAQLTVRELREKASELCVPYYTALSRADLLAKIKEKIGERSVSE